MKIYRLLIAAFLLAGIFSSFTLSAQDDREDVVYLKNGNIYRGIIVEQVPGKTIKVETLGGNVFTVEISDIIKLTKEKKVVQDSGDGQMRHPYGGPEMHHGEMGPCNFRHDRFYRYQRFDSTGGKPMHKEFHYRKRGYFFEAQLLGEMGQGGVRIINGYKFGQFGYLGIGVGADLVGFAPIGHYDFGGRNSPYTGTYMPLFLHYSGDFLKRRITPFYSIDAGYAIRFNGGGRGNNNFVTNQRGAMGGVGVGVKFYSKHRINFNISANADFQNVKYNGYYGAPNSFDRGMTWKHGNTLSLLTPGLKFAIGF
ncbi:MAG: hypothetical protein JWO03_827 [Bacteroidetes bacterium]|nr:hypothetical protein [Bacteroidota bacterium]